MVSPSFLTRLAQAHEDLLPVDEALVLYEMEEDAVAGYQPGMGRDQDDLEPFAEFNQRRPRRKADLEDRMALIRRQFPSVTYGTAQIKRAFDERPEVFRAMLGILLSVDASQDLRPGAPGPRPTVGYADGTRRIARLFGREYSSLPFAEAFKVLCGSRTVRAVAHKTGLTKTRISNLLHGQVAPTAADMEAAARAFALHPSFFIEWREAFVVLAVLERMSGSPETSMHVYAKFSGDQRGA